MKLLPNNCRLGNINVWPANWKTGGKSLLSKIWYITFRFYDDNLKKSKLVKVQGFSDYSTLEDRRAAVELRIGIILRTYTELGYNPITGLSLKPLVRPGQTDTDVTRYSSAGDALEFARKQMQISAFTMDNEVARYVGYIRNAINTLGYSDVCIWDMSLKQLYFICQSVAQKKDGTTSADKFNRCKKVLRMCYKKLLQFEVVPANLPLSLESRKKTDPKKKVLPTKEERDRIKAYLSVHDPAYLRFIQILFHSGGRITELLRIKVKDVNLATGYVTYLVMKGPNYSYKERPIKNIALPIWKEIIAGADPEHYVFSTGYILSLIHI